MSFSIQTNVNSLVAQENLRVNSNFQSQTIQRLTSGYRINSSADDAAGLSIANKFRSDVSELSQGVRNANDGISQLQIIDGGMNNISKMVDRLRTLATQSASDSFTGDRNVLDKEFTSVLNEIDRQAKAIGLDQGGQFAKSLSVYVGGGRTHGTGAIDTTNGSVTVDLASSAVDSQSLGLKGTQLVAGSVDIGSTHSAQDVSKLLAESQNTHADGVTTFYFAGAGFSDTNKMKVDVSTVGVTDIESLVNNINLAISDAGVGGTDQINAFRNTGIVASVHTDSTGGKQIAFTSTAGAFQVEAGDRLANAFMGNIDTGSAVGKALNTTAVAGANIASGAVGFTPLADAVKVRISGGGLDSSKDISIRANVDISGAIDNLIDDIANDDELSAAGITASWGGDGTGLTFTSAKGEQLNVMVSGDTAGALGFGKFMQGASNAVEYNSIDGSGYTNTTAYGAANFQFSFNGGTSTGFSIDLAGGNAQAATIGNGVSAPPAIAAADKFRITVDGVTHDCTFAGTEDSGTSDMGLVVAKINTDLGTWITAGMDASGKLTITTVAKGAAANVQVTAAGAGLLDFGLSGAGLVRGTSRTADDLVDAINGAISKASNGIPAAAGLKASNNAGVITIASDNGTNFRLATNGTGANAEVGFGAGGSAGAYTYAPCSTGASSVLASGNSNTGDIAFTAMKYGSSHQTVTFSTTDSTGALKSTTLTLQNNTTATTGRSLDEAINYINTQLQNEGGVLAKIVAVKDSTGSPQAEKINFLSSLESFNVSLGTDVNGAGLDTSETSIDSSTMSTGSINVANQSSAKQAVDALASAVSTLGTAQAAVGKGQNQLNYAIGLAQSQISNFSAAESRIRDADVASEAANLTKASVLQQASIAAMAQANSAPQAVLSLLRG